MLSLFERLLFLLIVAVADVIVVVPLCKHVMKRCCSPSSNHCDSYYHSFYVGVSGARSKFVVNDIINVIVVVCFVCCYC